jgi:hypothetical protein
MGYCSYVSGKKKFGVEFKTEITDMGSPRNDSVLEVLCPKQITQQFEIALSLLSSILLETDRQWR